MNEDDDVPCFLLISWNFSFKFINFWPLNRRLLIEWNFILLNGDVVDFFGWRVFADVFPLDGEIEDFVRDIEVESWIDVAEVVAATDDDAAAFINDGGVVLNGNQSR